MKKVPMRTCLVTKEKLAKRELIRVVKDKDNNVSIDLSGKANGRGCYLKKDKEVIAKAKKIKALERALELEIPNSIYEELDSYVKI